jgi:Na+/H+ antiporter NhaD/arsenite permease-like protein
MSGKEITVIIIFALTYLLIASRKLRLLPIGRPAGALLGALAMVAVGAITPEESYRAVDHDTLVLLFGMMMITVYLDEAGFFKLTAESLLKLSRSPRALLAGVALLAGALSAFLVNDAVCLFLTPVVILICQAARLPLGAFLLAVATSSNIGSAATLVGNPQNMIIGHMSGYPFALYLWRSLPAVLAGMAINIALLLIYFGRRLPERIEFSLDFSQLDRKRFLLAMLVVAGVVYGFFSGYHLGYTTVAGALVFILAEGQEPRRVFARVDWTLLVFFCGLFVVVGALQATGLVGKVWRAASPYLNFHDPAGISAFSALMLLGSNIVSNVPMVLLSGPHLSEFGNPQLGWLLLGFTTTIAGNFTLLGSVANIIVAESAREHFTLGFWEYLKFGLVSTLLVMIAGVFLLCWLWG